MQWENLWKNGQELKEHKGRKTKYENRRLTKIEGILKEYESKQQEQETRSVG